MKISRTQMQNALQHSTALFETSIFLHSLTPQLIDERTKSSPKWHPDKKHSYIPVTKETILATYLPELEFLEHFVHLAKETYSNNNILGIDY